MALMSGKVYSNTGAPSNADGVDGDIYLRLDGMKTTYRKESGSWVAVGSTLGAIPEIISGVGAPSNALGVDEQYYRDTSNQDIYYKQGSTWNLVGNLTGASFEPILDQAGIGKDLETAPNLINSGSLNAITTVGEYYYINNVTDTPAPYGLMKVWRKNLIYIYQLVQSSGYNGKLYNRYTEDGGATWGPWVSYASTDLATTNLAGLVEKATQAEMNAGADNVWPDAATILSGFDSQGQSMDLPSFLGNYGIRWGAATQVSAGEGTVSVVYSKPFPDTTLFATAIIENPAATSSGENDVWAQLISADRFGASFYVQSTAILALVKSIRWFAIGR